MLFVKFNIILLRCQLMPEKFTYVVILVKLIMSCMTYIVELRYRLKYERESTTQVLHTLKLQHNAIFTYSCLGWIVSLNWKNHPIYERKRNTYKASCTTSNATAILTFLGTSSFTCLYTHLLISWGLGGVIPHVCVAMVLEWDMNVGLHISILSVPDGGYFRSAPCT